MISPLSRGSADPNYSPVKQLPVCVESLTAQKTKGAPPLLPLNHPSKLMPSRLGARIHVSKASAHLLTTSFTSKLSA
jgi:hypothetical protein